MGSPIGVSTRVPVIGTISVSNGTRRGYEPHLVCTEAIIMASTAPLLILTITDRIGSY